MKWTAEYTRADLLFNVQEFQAPSKGEAEHMAWQGYMHLADCLTVTVYKLITPDSTTGLSERQAKKQGKGFRRMAA